MCANTFCVCVSYIILWTVLLRCHWELEQRALLSFHYILLTCSKVLAPVWFAVNSFVNEVKHVYQVQRYQETYWNDMEHLAWSVCPWLTLHRSWWEFWLLAWRGIFFCHWNVVMVYMVFTDAKKKCFNTSFVFQQFSAGGWDVPELIKSTCS